MYQQPDFAGDRLYCVCCTGDAVRGDQVKFQRAVFTGSLTRPKFSHFETIEGLIIKDSYGLDKQQHTFTLQHADGTKTIIKGRNLYRNGTWRRAWADESARKAILLEKHQRGDVARAARTARREECGVL
jgi:hypothetical protein